MADEADRANEQAERLLNAALNMRKPEGPDATGYCLWCGEPLTGKRRWCDAKCRDAWEDAVNS